MRSRGAARKNELTRAGQFAEKVRYYAVVPGDESLSIGAARRHLRARRLYRWGQSVAALGGPVADQRAARLYLRGLRVLGAPPSRPASDARRLTASVTEPAGSLNAARQAAREELRAALARRGLRGFAERRPLLTAGVLGVIALLLVIRLVAGWLAPDLAEGKRWSASSGWGPFPVEGVMSGEAPIDGRFHTNEESFPWVLIDLGGVYDVHAVKVENRVNCCRERALPLRIELSVDNKTFWRVAYRRAIFESFTARFAERKARYVRLVVDRRSTLHLRRVAVY